MTVEKVYPTRRLREFSLVTCTYDVWGLAKIGYGGLRDLILCNMGYMDKRKPGSERKKNSECHMPMATYLLTKKRELSLNWVSGKMLSKGRMTYLSTA